MAVRQAVLTGRWRDLVRDAIPLPGAIGTFCGSVAALGGDSAYVGPLLSGDPIGNGPVSIVERLPYFKGARR